ncbi:hypothetical protein QYE76_053571 [Lolium multiflorum]|uniref:Uncharacterized protein n=1 Tax=Lolium multiflorum TaxID=4521 RepID=A0AAD8SWF4_LOLMU|nr:hypothetical protein QYE76_053571 [Lolium multiflorum]
MEHQEGYELVYEEPDLTGGVEGVDYGIVYGPDDMEWYAGSPQITLLQSHYVEKILSRFGYSDCKSSPTPYDPSVIIRKNKRIARDQLRYSQIIGSLMYLASATRPDISFAVSKLNRFVSRPGDVHWHALERVLRYLKGTASYGIHYTGYPRVLEGYSDANWISDADETKATSGYLFTLGGGAVSWKSCKQTIITRSTMEAELTALDTATVEAEWLRELLMDLPVVEKPIPAIPMNCDNQTVIIKVFGERSGATTGITTSSSDDEFLHTDNFFPDLSDFFDNLNMGDNDAAAKLPVGPSYATTTSTSEMAEEPIKYEDLPPEHKKKYDELKATFEADLIGSSRRPVRTGSSLKGSNPKRVALNVVQEIMKHKYSPSGPALGTHQGEIPLYTRPPLQYTFAAPQQQGSPAYVVYKVGGDPGDYQFLYEPPKEIPHGYVCTYVPDCNNWMTPVIAGRTATAGEVAGAGSNAGADIEKQAWLAKYATSTSHQRSTSAAPTVDEITAIMRDQFGILPKKRMIGYSAVSQRDKYKRVALIEMDEDEDPAGDQEIAVEWTRGAKPVSRKWVKQPGPKVRLRFEQNGANF